ncbi:MAG: ABC transporter permease [Candidatus Cyclobacteriaceae bacterium M3_2C_046]
MLKNYFKIAYRNLINNKVYSLINIIGLSVGMTCCLLIYLYVQDELSFDQFQLKKDQIYRLVYHSTSGMDLAQTPPPISPLLPEFFPEVETSARIYQRNVSVKVPDQDQQLSEYEEEMVLFADSTILDILTFDFISGYSDQLLKEPFTVILNQEVARKYFGQQDPLGKTILLLDNIPCKVVAIARDFPAQSHLHFNMILPYDNMYDLENDQASKHMRQNLAINWVISHSYTYVLLKEGADPDQVNAGMNDLVNTHAQERMRAGQTFSLEPLQDIHLYSRVLQNQEQQGNIRFIYLFSGVALITLLIACFNFINLSTAHSIKRAREVGMRKALGATKKWLFLQFLGESILISFLAFILAILLVSLGLPELNLLTGKQLSFSLLLDWQILLVFLLIFIITGVLGGTYPAFYMTRLNLLTTLKGKVSQKSRGFSLRKLLVTLQFASSIALIAGTIIIFKQLNYLMNKPLGFNTEEIINVPVFSNNFNFVFGGVNGPLRQRLNTFEEEMLRNADIKAITLSSVLPGISSISRMTIPEGHPEDDPIFVPTIAVDYDFLQTYDMELIAGRNFSKETGTDHINAFIVNEEAVKDFHWESADQALGKEINLEGKEGIVIGVVRDFHMSSLHEPIRPLILEINVAFFSTFSIRINTARTPQTLSLIGKQWKEFFPEKTFEYSFLRSDIDDQYNAENNLARIIGIFAFIAIFVSCLGSYGLIMFSARQREKELGVRKVLGASVFRLIRLMALEFTGLFLLGFLIAIPISYYLMDQWLTDFSFRINIDLSVFLISGLLALILIWLTISYQSIKAATINPVEMLRDE